MTVVIIVIIIELSKCVYLASLDEKLTIQLAVKSKSFFFFFFFFFQNACLMVMPVETWATTKETIAKIYAFVHRNLMVYTEIK